MIKAIITDIEGTTSSLSFVKDTLFPYARTHMGEFVRTHEHEIFMQQLLNAVREKVKTGLTTEQIIVQLIQWIDDDQKITPLKALQGLIWEAGYRKGDFTGHLYDDALVNLQHWHAQGIALYVYSSGSIYAQKLLFSHTTRGDLTPLFSGYFDTQIGGKKESSSYEKIVTHVNFSATELLFLSDSEEELDAAKSAGLQTCWLTRDTRPNSQATHWQVADFDAIELTRF